ncbi:Uncharacterized protein YyaL [Geodia barretti]|uniref:Uncharacterized protein YyaL n=1 Tax=Geodia barretti TaxID=519541 RepID=A0AA35XDF8_GEOBA|nr:Uncharacterized protein YyaL [Geodia barretti]
MRLNLRSAINPFIHLLICLFTYFCIIASSFGGTVYAAEDPHSHEAALKNPDGTWKWTNALIGETSPYLLLHAHNPVDWYPWGPEALDRAKAENKPIFLSVGYSTCYWCHVMERKVFSDPEIANLMNALFINIKVDREERPDIDEIYMTATQIMTGSGGWPNSVFLTPDLLPFFGGTYFPPEDSRGRPGFPRVLNALHEVWMNQQADVIAQAEKITEVIVQATAATPASAEETPLDRKLVSAAVKALQSSVAKSLKKSEEDLHSQLEPLKAKLLTTREKRKQPLLDTKVIVSWNGLMIDAFAYGYEVLGDKRYRDVAEKAALFNLKHLRTADGQLMRTYRDGVAKYNGYLDDYAFLVRGLLGLHQATGEKSWLNEAKSLTDTMNQLFWDDKNGGFYFTLANQKHLVVRTKNPYDSALPSGNAVAANNLLILAHHLGEKDYLDKAEKTLQNFAGMMEQSPSAFMHMLFATNRYLSTDWTKVGAAPQEESAQFGLNTEGRSTINLFGLPKAPVALPSEHELLTLAASIPSKGAIFPGNAFDVEVQLELAEGWHINANPSSWDLLIPTTVSVSLMLPSKSCRSHTPRGSRSTQIGGRLQFPSMKKTPQSR